MVDVSIKLCEYTPISVISNDAAIKENNFVVTSASEVEIFVNTAYINAIKNQSLVKIEATSAYAGTTTYCAIPSQTFFNFNSSCYSNEKKLYSRVVSEAYDQQGVKCDYYVVDYSLSNEKIFGEDNDRHIVRNFKMKVYFETPPESRQYNQLGMEDLDVFQMYTTKEAFSYYSANYEPKYGDLIRPFYNGVIYEILHVIDTEEQFLNTQHTWKFTVRPWQNNMLTTDNTVQNENVTTYDGKTVKSIKDHTDNGSDSLKQNDLIDSVKDEILYNDPNGDVDPFGGW